MLNMKKVQQMTDIIHVSIPYSGIEHSVISTPVYNRLHRILQSSLVFLTYPSNKVKRFEHSIGVMHLAGEIFFNSVCNSRLELFEEFMEVISQEIITWRNELDFDKYSFVATELRTKYKDKDILSATVPESNFYNKYFPGNLKDELKFAYFVTFQAIRLAGLLHDVGHLPYSHILEHALKKMYVSIKNKENISNVENEFIEIMQRFAKEDDEERDEIHEEIGKLLIKNIKNSIIQDIIDRSNPDIYFFLVSFDFAEKIICSKVSDNTIFSDLHLITASVLDADRLDYCSRDSYCSGTNKTIMAYDRLLGTYELKKIENDNKENRFYFCPSFKAISSVEELLRRRKEIFSDINFHHRVHKHEVLLEEVISMLGIRELEKMEKVENLPRTLPLCVSSIWQLISRINSKNDWPEYQIIQLDDSWLDTLLKHNFFEIYGTNYLSLRENGNDILWNRFDELISSNKRYHSLLKRANDFKEFDKKFFEKFNENYDNIDEYITEKIPLFSTYNQFFDEYHSFLFNYCIDIICITDTYKERFFENFEKETNCLIKSINLNINDCLLRSCMFSFGYKTAKTPLFVSDDKRGVKIEQVSSQLESFQKERAISPTFHLFYLPVYNKIYNIYNTVDKEKVVEILAEAAINIILNFKKLV